MIFSTLMYYAEHHNPDPEMAHPSGTTGSVLSCDKSSPKAAHYSSVSTSMWLGCTSKELGPDASNGILLTLQTFQSNWLVPGVKSLWRLRENFSKGHRISQTFLPNPRWVTLLNLSGEAPLCEYTTVRCLENQDPQVNSQSVKVLTSRGWKVHLCIDGWLATKGK